MTRREFGKKALAASVAVPVGMQLFGGENESGKNGKRIPLGGPVNRNEYSSPESWILALNAKGYTAAYCPVDESASDSTIKAYEIAAKEAGIIIAEVGAWSNPISPDAETREKAIEKCITKLALANQIGARCCVNVSGSRGTEKNGGPHPDNLTQETFDMIVEATQKIIDAVNPTRTHFALECMPASFPDSTISYVDLIKGIDRKGFAAHFDPVNMVNSPRRYFGNAEMIREGFQKLGKSIKSCHAKDTLLSTHLTTHIDEVACGKGNLDYQVYLTELAKLDDVPLMMEHMKPEEYSPAAEYIRKVGSELGIEV